MEGPNVDTIGTTTGVIEIPVASEAVVYTPAIKLKQGEYFAVSYKATSDGDVKLKIEFEQCFTEPTQVASDVRSVLPENISAIESALADENWHHAKIQPVALPYGRFKITGLADPSGNDASTTIQLKIGILGRGWNVIGPSIRDILAAAGGTTLTITAGGTIYTESFSLKYGLYFALAYKAASGGAIDLTLQLEQSYQKPGTEGASDADWVIPENMSDIHANLADANWHHIALTPVAMPYGRLKITSAAGVTNTLLAKLSVQEELG